MRPALSLSLSPVSASVATNAIDVRDHPSDSLLAFAAVVYLEQGNNITQVYVIVAVRQPGKTHVGNDAPNCSNTRAFITGNLSGGGPLMTGRTGFQDRGRSAIIASHGVMAITRTDWLPSTTYVQKSLNVPADRQLISSSVVKLGNRTVEEGATNQTASGASNQTLNARHAGRHGVQDVELHLLLGVGARRGIRMRAVRNVVVLAFVVVRLGINASTMSSHRGILFITGMRLNNRSCHWRRRRRHCKRKEARRRCRGQSC